MLKATVYFIPYNNYFDNDCIIVVKQHNSNIFFHIGCVLAIFELISAIIQRLFLVKSDYLSINLREKIKYIIDYFFQKNDYFPILYERSITLAIILSCKWCLLILH
jgi:hypothetical protein